MGNQRIHKLAAEWGTTSKEIIDRLERMGITGKKAQSGLAEADAVRVREEMGLTAVGADAPPQVTRRTVEIRDATRDGSVTAVDTITETRVKSGVVLRRRQRTNVGRGPAVSAAPLRTPRAKVHAVTAVNVAPEVLSSYEPGEFNYASFSLSAVSGAELESANGAAANGAAGADDALRAGGLPGSSDVRGPFSPGSGAEVEEEDHIPVPIEESDKLAEEMLSRAEAAERARIEEIERQRLEQEERERLAREAEESARAAAKAEAEAEAEAAAEARTKAETEGEQEQAASDEAVAETPDVAETAPVAKPATGPRVLGRIDLSKQAKPVLPEAKTEEAKKEGDADAAKPGRKKKRKVVRKEDMFDAFERSFQGRQRRPMKKRVAPGQKVAKTEVTVPKERKRVIKINEVTTPGELAKAMSVKAGEVLGAMMRLGAMKSINDAVDIDTATLVAEEFGYTVENTAVSVEKLLQTETAGEETTANGSTRPPVVTVMGHVDHGKTSLLDRIRVSNVASSEAGGITQHIGAYMVDAPNGAICFLDTPGHAAFTQMRARGASVTDVVVLVVAADDGVMPQTIEAINHAKAANLPVVVAVNKIDRPDANQDRIKQQLSEHGLQPEDWGGDTQFVPVSALQGTGINELLEAIVLSSQMLELTAPIDRPAHGVVIEARLDRGRGPVATLLVQQGTLNRGDYYVVGETTGRVRAMMDHAGKAVKSAGPSHAVEIIGLDAVPQAGDVFDVVEDLARAQQIAEHRSDAGRQVQSAASARMSLEDLQRQVAAGDVSELKAIIKADVQGTAEALKNALEKLSNAEVTLNVIHYGVGAISESDVQLAMASKAVIIGFHVRPEAKARAAAEREGIDMRLHTVIYEAIDEVKAALEGMLEPEFREAFEGRAEVRDTFNVPGGNVIAGSYITDGKITRNSPCRLLRDNVVIHTGTVGSLRRFKDDVREVQSGYECGIGLDRYNDLKVGDIIECYRMDEIKRTLESAKAAPEPDAGPE